MSEPVVKVSTDLSWIFFGALLIAFWGEPDLIDAIIYDLTGVKNWEQHADDPTAL